MAKENEKEFENLIYEKKKNVAWITLNRPEVLNALNDSLRKQIIIAFEKARDDDEVSIIVLSGAGDKAFCAGADVREFSSLSAMDIINKYKGKKRPYNAVRDMPKPVIAMVNGLAIGGGCELAIACDMIVASEDARFGQAEINVGIIPGGGATQMLPRLVGEKKAKELIFTGSFIPAAEALRIGLVNKVVSKEKLREAVEEIINKLNEKSPAILKLAKLAINKSLDTAFTVGVSFEEDLSALCFGTEDQKEGARAFMEKRKPQYKGK